MYHKTQHLLVGDFEDTNKVDMLNTPIACQYANLCSNDTHRIHNEQSKWLEELNGKLPLWSRLKTTNCFDYPRPVMFSKQANYENEIPGRLLSIFGTTTLQTKLINKMKDMENSRLLSNILALCAALKFDFKEWSTSLLDNIVMEAVNMYPELLKRQTMNDIMFNLSHMNQIYQFEEVDYKVQLQQVATGYLYIRYGVNEFNLARALTWFFHNYQFGLLQCCNRTLAFGCTLDSDYGFFMYDCQSQGFPLFEEQQANSYILRTQHLQILLYCLIMTLNIKSEMIKFFIYNVDIRILNSSEMKSIKKEIYVPTIIKDINKIAEKKVDCGTNQKTPKSKPSFSTINKDKVPKDTRLTKALTFSTNSKVNKNINRPGNIANKVLGPAKNINTTTMKPLNSTISLSKKFLKKPIANYKTKNSILETLKIQDKDSTKEIQLEPNKMYFIISVPKESHTTLIVQDLKQQIDRKQGQNPEIEKPELESNQNIQLANNFKSQNLAFQEVTDFESINLNKSDSTITLSPDTLEEIKVL